MQNENSFTLGNRPPCTDDVGLFGRTLDSEPSSNLCSEGGETVEKFANNESTKPNDPQCIHWHIHTNVDAAKEYFCTTNACDATCAKLYVSVTEHPHMRFFQCGTKYPHCFETFMCSSGCTLPRDAPYLVLDESSLTANQAGSKPASQPASQPPS